jgi:hypothetical protein
MSRRSVLVAGQAGITQKLLDIIESPPDTSAEALQISIRFHIIKIREIRAVHNVADLIFVAVQTWHLPELEKFFEHTPDHLLPLSNTCENAWAPPLVILNADSLTQSPSFPSVNWKTGVMHRKTYFNGTVTNELSQIRLFPFDWDDLRIIASSSVDARFGQKGMELVPEKEWTTSNMIPFYLESSVQEWEIVTSMSHIGIWDSDGYKKKYISNMRRSSSAGLISSMTMSKREKGDSSGGSSSGGDGKLHPATVKEGDEEGDDEEIISERASEDYNTNTGVTTSSPNLGAAGERSSPQRLSSPERSNSPAPTAALSGVEITVHVRRRYEYYFYKIILIFNLIIMMGWGIGVTPHDEIIGRLTMVFTAATAAFAFMYTIQQELPKLAFLTFIDKQMVSGIFCLAAQALQSVVAYKMDSPKIDTICAIVIPILYIIFNISISIGVYRARSSDALKEHREEINKTENEVYSLKKNR